MQRYEVISTYETDTLTWFVSRRYTEADQDSDDLKFDIEATAHLGPEDQEDAIIYRQHLRGLRDQQFTEDEAIEFQELLLAEGYEAHVKPVSRPEINDTEQLPFLIAKHDWSISGRQVCPNYNLPFEVHAWRMSQIPPEFKAG
jgi:hypothetical protein